MYLIEIEEFIELLFDESKDRFLVLSKSSLYIFNAKELKLIKIFDGLNLTSMAGPKKLGSKFKFRVLVDISK